MYTNSTEKIKLDDLIKLNGETCIDSRDAILELLAVFWPTDLKDSYSEFKSKILEISWTTDKFELQKAFFKLAFALKEKNIIQFQNDFCTYIENAKKEYGDYFCIALKPKVTLLFIIGRRNEMWMTINIIFKNFPSIDVNSTIMTNLKDVQFLHHVYKPSTIWSENLKKIVRLALSFFTITIFINNDPQEDEISKLDCNLLEVVESVVQKFDFMNEIKLDEVHRFILGRREDGTTLLEMILKKPGAANLIRLIWGKLRLFTREEILNYVSNKLQVIPSSLLTFRLFGRINLR